MTRTTKETRAAKAAIKETKEIRASKSATKETKATRVEKAATRMNSKLYPRDCRERFDPSKRRR